MEVFVGQLLLVGFSFAPVGWAFCNGSLLPISGYEALYSLLGTTYGGDGVSTFGLPDLRGRIPIGVGALPGGGNYTLGQMGGAENVLIDVNTYPTHSHSVGASGVAGNGNSPKNSTPASGQTIYVSSPTLTAPLNSQACQASAGGTQPHTNLQPYLTLNWIISLGGVYPSQG
jgi:microcystin-dependent protein